MSDNIKKLNKQIAAFMLTSLALSTIASADAALNKKENIIADTSFNANYNLKNQYISMYAAPQYPIDIHPIKPMPQPQPIMPMYAAPEIPIKDMRLPHEFIPVEVIERQTTKQIPNMENINNSLINTDRNLEKVLKPSMTNASDFVNQNTITNTNRNFGDINMYNKSGNLIYNKYGSYKTIEPASYTIHQ